MTGQGEEVKVFDLPDLGEGLSEAEIIAWRVAPGDTVEIDQIVVDVETAKAAVEVPVPFAGTVRSIHAEPGAVLAVGKPLISVAATVMAAGEAARAEGEEATDDEGSGHVLIGYGTGPVRAGRKRRTRLVAPAPLLPVEAPSVDVPVTVPSSLAPRVISPLVRRRASQHGIDVATIVPSGRGGVVLRRDLEAAIGADGPAAEARSAGGVGRPADTGAGATDRRPDFATDERPGAAPDDQRIPLRGARRIVAEKLSRSRTEIPEVTTWVDVDATGLLDARSSLDAAGRPVSLLALLARICVSGLSRYPDLNTSVDTQRAEIVRHGRVHLGVAAQTDRGLVVPVIRDAHRLSTSELADELRRLTERARAGQLSPAELTGGTFTLNNYGVFGVDGSTPIINHPEAALLGIGRIIDKPWVHDGQVVARKVTQLSLTFDHRVCDGGTAGGYLRYVADAVENPLLLLAD